MAEETLASEAVEVRVVLRVVGAAVPVDEVEDALVAVEAAEEEEVVDEPSVMLNWFCWWAGYVSLRVHSVVPFPISVPRLSLSLSLSLFRPTADTRRTLRGPGLTDWA